MSDHIPDAGKKVREDFEAWAASAAEAMKQAHTHLMFAAACNGVTVLDSVGVQETCEALHEAIVGRKPMQAATQHSAARIAELEAEVKALRRDAERYRAINTPEIADFLAAVHNEALHQRERWGSDHDAGKTDADWFWLLGYLCGKAMHAQNDEKRLHHIITTAAACLNWHAARVGMWTAMRPGSDPAIEAYRAKP